MTITSKGEHLTSPCVCFDSEGSASQAPRPSVGRASVEVAARAEVHVLGYDARKLGTERAHL